MGRVEVNGILVRIGNRTCSRCSNRIYNPFAAGFDILQGDRMSECDWCKQKANEKVILDMGDRMVFTVCDTCALDYVEGRFDVIKSKIKKVKGNGKQKNIQGKG